MTSLVAFQSLRYRNDSAAILTDRTLQPRLLQPSIVVIEDVDLIARNHTQMISVCEEVMLNKLLNEMDGLKEDADKELMRRVVQYHIERDGTGDINRHDIDSAVDEMLFKGGTLNLKLLGASGRPSEELNPCPIG